MFISRRTVCVLSRQHRQYDLSKQQKVAFKTFELFMLIKCMLTGLGGLTGYADRGSDTKSLSGSWTSERSLLYLLSFFIASVIFPKCFGLLTVVKRNAHWMAVNGTAIQPTLTFIDVPSPNLSESGMQQVQQPVPWTFSWLSPCCRCCQVNLDTRFFFLLHNSTFKPWFQNVSQRREREGRLIVLLYSCLTGV